MVSGNVNLSFASPYLGLWDNHKSVTAYKIIDASSLCPDAEQVLIKYANTESGRIAQICQLYEPEKDLGLTVHYFINRESIKSLSEDDTFVIRCAVMGVDPKKLSMFIFLHQ